MKKVYNVALEQFRRDSLWASDNYDVQAPTAETAIRKARTLFSARSSGNGVLKSYPVIVTEVKLITRKLQ